MVVSFHRVHIFNSNTLICKLPQVFFDPNCPVYTTSLKIRRTYTDFLAQYLIAVEDLHNLKASLSWESVLKEV